MIDATLILPFKGDAYDLVYVLFVSGLAFNFIASFSRDGGSVPEVYVFKKFEGKPQEAASKMVAAKAAKGLDGVFVSTNNLTFFAGMGGNGLRSLAFVILFLMLYS